MLLIFLPIRPASALASSRLRFFGPLPEAEDQSSDIGICVVNKTHRRVYTGSRSLLW